MHVLQALFTCGSIYLRGAQPGGSKPRGYYGTELRYGTVRFWQKVRYRITYEIFRKSTVRKYGIIFSVPYTFRTAVTHPLHLCFQVLHFSFLPVTLPRQLRSPLTLVGLRLEFVSLLCHNYDITIVALLLCSVVVGYCVFS